MMDREDDRRLGLKSSAILFGRHDVLAVMVCHALFLGILAFVGVWAHLGAFYFLGIALAAVAVGYQYVLIRDRDRQKAFQAFLSNNVVGVAIFAGIAIDFMLRIPLF
jgi:4-hydroxybenzoate polyprenyltransferase